MLRYIVIYGAIGGLIVALPMIGLMVLAGPATFEAGGLLYGYLSMILALTTVFLGVKQYRDTVRGGVIKFGPALLVGLGISTVASIFYTLGWEISLAWTGYDFAGAYSNSMVETLRAKGASAAELQKAIDDAKVFVDMYNNPLNRMPMTFIEMFPVGVLISFVSAALLRNSRLLPARAA